MSHLMHFIDLVFVAGTCHFIATVCFFFNEYELKHKHTSYNEHMHISNTHA